MIIYDVRITSMFKKILILKLLKNTKSWTFRAIVGLIDVEGGHMGLKPKPNEVEGDRSEGVHLQRSKA